MVVEHHVMLVEGGLNWIRRYPTPGLCGRDGSEAVRAHISAMEHLLLSHLGHLSDSSGRIKPRELEQKPGQV